MKKTLVCFLAILLLMPAVSQAQGILDFFFGGTSSGLTLRYVPVQDEAFETKEDRLKNRLMGTSGDGNMLLVYSNFEIYLWDQTTRSRIPITFVRQEDAEGITALMPRAVAMNGMPSLSRQMMEEVPAKVEEYLGAHGLTAFENLDQIYDCFPQLIPLGAQCAGISDHWALVNCVTVPCALAIDLRNGDCIVFFNDNQPRSFCDDRVLLADGVLNLETREMTYMDQLGLMLAQDDGRPELFGMAQHMKLCADGSILAIGYEGSINFEEGNDYWLVDVRTDSNRAIKIGTFTYSDAPNTMMTTEDERWLFLYSVSAPSIRPFVILDRETGNIIRFEPGKYLPVAATKNGFMCWDLDTYDIMFLNPETGEPSKVTLASGFDWACLDYNAISSIVENGLGMYFEPVPSTPSRDAETVYIHGYFVLEGE